MRTEALRRHRRPPGVLVLVQNLPLAVDRRVRLECAALLEAGHRVSVICPKGEHTPSYQVDEGVHVHSYPPPPEVAGTVGYLVEFAYCWLRTALLSLRVLRRHGFDVIQGCNPPDTFWLLALLYRPFGKRYVFDQHDLCPEVYSSRFARCNPLLLSALSWLERANYAVADHVVSTNESYRRLAVERGGKALDAITVVRSGPDPARMVRGAEVPELRRGREHVAVYLGVMGPQDGVDYLLRAIAHVVHDLGRRDCSFALLGFGDSLGDLRRLATRLDLDDYVDFPGRADEDMIRDYLSTASVGLSPDPKNPLNDLSTMNKTLEYMAFALPVVAFDLTETRVSAGDAAIYVEPNDEHAYAKALEGLLDRPAERATLGRLGRARIVDGLSWPHQKPQYVSVFDRVGGDAPSWGRRRARHFPVRQEHDDGSEQ